MYLDWNKAKSLHAVYACRKRMHFQRQLGKTTVWTDILELQFIFTILCQQYFWPAWISKTKQKWICFGSSKLGTHFRNKNTFISKCSFNSSPSSGTFVSIEKTGVYIIEHSFPIFIKPFLGTFLFPLSIFSLTKNKDFVCVFKVLP